MSSHEQGFTLVEVLVALVLIAVALLATAGMMTVAYRTLQRGDEQTTATILAEQRTEWLRAQGFTSGSLTAGTSNEVLTGTYAGYTRSTTITDNSPAAGVKQIQVTATAPSGFQQVVTSCVGN